MKNLINISVPTKKVLIGIFIIICASLTVAYIYYNGKNRAEDPRVVETKYLFKQFDELMKTNEFASALPMLDTIEMIFKSVPGYAESYETGIVYNDRGSAWLSMALYVEKDSVEKSRLLSIARTNIDSAIFIYSNWLENNGELSGEQLSQIIAPHFPEEDNTFRGKKYSRIIQKRVDDLILAQKETPRRLSVSYTNLGIIQRHQFMQEEAIASYTTAIKLWKDNFTARNNFNVLMGLPPEDRSIINKLFPPDKNKFD